MKFLQKERKKFIRSLFHCEKSFHSTPLRAAAAAPLDLAIEDLHSGAEHRLAFVCRLQERCVPLPLCENRNNWSISSARWRWRPLENIVLRSYRKLKSPQLTLLLMWLFFFASFHFLNFHHLFFDSLRIENVMDFLVVPHFFLAAAAFCPPRNLFSHYESQFCSFHSELGLQNWKFNLNQFYANYLMDLLDFRLSDRKLFHLKFDSECCRSSAGGWKSFKTNKLVAQQVLLKIFDRL